MKDEAADWLKYANENFQSAKILAESKLFNPCLQNIQQSVEKALKAIFAEYSMALVKTHSINELKNILHKNSIHVDISDEECDFLDSIYLPSKYPISSVLPFYEPTLENCMQGINIVQKVIEEVTNRLKITSTS
jgi:HEPN domain-containing protein